MLNEKLVKEVAKKIDDLIDFREITGKPILGSLLEAADGFILVKGLSYLNDKWGDTVLDAFTDEVEKVFQCFIDDDYEGILDIIPDSLDEMFDIAAFGSDFEAKFIAINFKAIVEVIKYYVLGDEDVE